jgi:hypothetical protein
VVAAFNSKAHDLIPAFCWESAKGRAVNKRWAISMVAKAVKKRRADDPMSTGVFVFNEIIAKKWFGGKRENLMSEYFRH